MKNLIRVYRFTKTDCLVSIMEDRATGKYCYVNLTSQHVCQCRFDTFEQALADLLTREDVKTFYFVKNGELAAATLLNEFGLPKEKDMTIPDTCKDRDEWLEKGIL